MHICLHTAVGRYSSPIVRWNEVYSSIRNESVVNWGKSLRWITIFTKRRISALDVPERRFHPIRGSLISPPREAISEEKVGNSNTILRNRPRIPRNMHLLRRFHTPFHRFESRLRGKPSIPGHRTIARKRDFWCIDLLIFLCNLRKNII